MSDQSPHVEKNLVEKNRVEKSLEDVLSEACRALSLINDMATGFAAASSDAVDMRMESWGALSELARSAKAGLDAACDALPASLTETHIYDWKSRKLAAARVAHSSHGRNVKSVTKPAA